MASVYLTVMMAVYPFYMKEGYVNISTHKYNFFMYSSLGAVLLLCLFGFKILLAKKKKVNVTGIAVLIFMGFTTVSYLLSVDKSESFKGTEGWFMGFLTMVVMCVSYILVSELWNYKKFIIPLALASGTAVFILAVLDRFSIYLIPLEIRDPAFISTMGNINWFMGYYSIFTPLGAGLFVYDLMHSKEAGFRLYLEAAYTFIAFTAGFAQGAESVLLFYVSLITGMVFLVYRGFLRLDHVCFTVGLMALSAKMVYLLKVLLPGKYNYTSGGLCEKLTDGNILMILGIAIIILGLILMRINENEKTDPERIRKLEKISCTVFFILLISALGSWLLIGYLKTFKGEFPTLTHSMFVFDTSFGSGRGEAYKTAVSCLKEMNVRQLLFGVGPDAFYAYAYSFEHIKNDLYAFWGNDRLTNAHSELLTMLVNEGIFGMLSYLGIFVSFTVTSLKSKNVIKTVISLAVWCYLIHNLISFSQVLSTPFLFLLMAIGSSTDNSNETENTSPA